MIRLYSRAIRFTATSAMAASLLVIGQAHAQTEATAQTDSSVSIIAPITLTKETNLAFGSIARGSSGSNTVTINHTTGAASIAGVGNATLLSGGTSNATYTVAGEDGATFSIEVDDDVTLMSDSETILVTLESAASTGTLTSGEATFGVGGSLTIDENTSFGTYTGTFDVTVAYN